MIHKRKFGEFLANKPKTKVFASWDQVFLIRKPKYAQLIIYNFYVRIYEIDPGSRLKNVKNKETNISGSSNLREHIWGIASM